jgi:hypothetical protein
MRAFLARAGRVLTTLAGAQRLGDRAEGWAHLTQDRNDLERSFATLGLGSRLRLLEPGKPTTIELPQ